jgi:hypothetical protein
MPAAETRVDVRGASTLKAWELDRQRIRAREQVGARLWLRFSTSFAPALAADDVGCRVGA